MMRLLITVFALWCAPAFGQSYQEVSRSFTISSQPAMYAHVSASNCNSPAASVNCAPGPHIIDLRGLHPMMAAAKSVRLDGMLIITHGPTPGIAYLQVALDRADNPNFGCAYIVGATEEASVASPSPLLRADGGPPWSSPGGGQRTNLGAWVPVSNGQIKMCSTYTGPSDSTWAVTLYVSKFEL